MALAFVSVILFLGITELLLRLVDLDTTFQNRFFLVNRALDYPDVFRKDHRLFWRFRADKTITSRFFEGRTYHINSAGMRGEERAIDPATPEIIVLGNSCSFGWGIYDDSTFASQLERKLDGAYAVTNAAVPGYSTLQGKRYLESELLQRQPALLIVLLAWNDHWAAAGGIADKVQQFPPQWLLDVQNVLSQLHIYRLLKKTLLSAVETDPESLFDRENIVYRVGPEDFERNLMDIVNLSRQNGIHPLLLTSPIPSLETYYPPGARSPMHDFHNRYNDIIRKVAHSLGADLIDLASLFDQRGGLWDDAPRDPIHFNASGHALAAKALARHIFGLEAEADGQSPHDEPAN
jgi:lysophospholipase L1-like esterase